MNFYQGRDQSYEGGAAGAAAPNPALNDIGLNDAQPAGQDAAARPADQVGDPQPANDNEGEVQDDLEGMAAVRKAG